MLLCEKTENKSADEYVFQYRNAANYMQKREAIDSLRRYQRLNYDAMMVYRDGLKDKSESIRVIAAKNISITANNRDTVLPMLKALLEKDSISRVRAAVLDAFGKQQAKSYEDVVEKYLGDSSYTVASTALTVLNKLDSAKALEKAKLFERETTFEMKNAVYTINSQSGDSSYNTFFIKRLNSEKGFVRSFLMYHYANFLLRMNAEMAEAGIDTMRSVTLSVEDNKQLKGFAVGAIERIKDNYEREKAIYDNLLNSDKKTKAKYDLEKVKRQQARAASVITHAKEAEAEIKK